jgi:RNA polymerase sigma factor (TIGR02999 family)
MSDSDDPPRNELQPQVYERLRQLAHRYLQGQSGETLNTTALVHEAYLNLQRMDPAHPIWRDRAHFLGYAATAMRHIVVDHARRRNAHKRRGDLVALDRIGEGVEGIAIDSMAGELVALDAALNHLEKSEPRLARVVELRFFAGLSVEDAAEALAIHPRSVIRDWQKARLLLHRALSTGVGQ